MTESIYAPPNKYGYQININHPKIKPIYERYKRKNSILIMSDAERHEFEEKLIKWLSERKNENE